MSPLPPFNTAYPGAGDVLIASPELPDGNFARTLVYLKEHSGEGSLGLILNRPLGQTLSQLMPGAEFPEPLADLPMFFGGPAQTDQFLLCLFRTHPVSHRFSCDLNPDRDAVRAALDDPFCHLRAFVGYAGWTEGQLRDELSGRDWLWTPSDEVMISPAPTPGLWELLARGDFRWQEVRDFLPARPELN